MAVTTPPRWWWTRLAAALRAAFACSIVGGVTVFGPAALRNFLSFSAFSYFTAILIVLSDVVSLGSAVRGGWEVVGAVVPVFVSSVPCLWLIGPRRFNSGLAAAAVAVSALVVAVPERVELLTKRIAFGQMVVVYVGTVVHGGESGSVMHPLRVVASAAIGAVASVLAMMLPLPRLSSGEVRKLCRFYSENAGERLDLLVESFGAKSKPETLASIAQIKSLSISGTKLLHSIERNLEEMVWERPRISLKRPNYLGIAEKLQEFEVAVRGMESALACPSFAFGKIDAGLGDLLKDLKEKAILKLEQVKCSVPPNATTAPETKGGFSDTSPLKLSSITRENLSPSFFLRCMDLLLHDSIASSEEAIALRNRENCSSKDSYWGNLSNMLPTNRNLYAALKCSLTLGLAVFLGLTYTKQNGYWAGLTVAISLATERQAIFTIANARAQGTAMGSFYGVICCFILRKYEYLWLLPLLPWVVFSSFLVHSRMYGQAGATSAALGALLILGRKRKNYGLPTEFANARIAEACIGLLCLVTFEILFNQTRAATLAKAEFSKCLAALRDCVETVTLIPRKNLYDYSVYISLREQHKILKSHVNQLEKFISEARFEPNLWFTPFQTGCYDNLLNSLMKIVDILQFLLHEVKFLSLEASKSGVVMKELHDGLSKDMELFNRVGCCLKFMEKMTQLKSLKELPNRNDTVYDEMEMGKSPSDEHRAVALSEEEIDKIIGSFCEDANKVVCKIYSDENEVILRSQMSLCLSSIGFCMKWLMRETMEMEKEVFQVLKLENPSIRLTLQVNSLK